MGEGLTRVEATLACDELSAVTGTVAEIKEQGERDGNLVLMDYIGK